MSQESDASPGPSLERGCLVAMLMILWPASDVLLGGLVVALLFRHPLSFLSPMVYRVGFLCGLLVLIAALLMHYVIGPLGIAVFPGSSSRAERAAYAVIVLLPFETGVVGFLSGSSLLRYAAVFVSLFGIVLAYRFRFLIRRRRIQEDENHGAKG